MLMQPALQACLPPWLTFHTHSSCLPNKLGRQGLSLDPLFFKASIQLLLSNSAEQINAFILLGHKRIFTCFVLAAVMLVRIFGT